MYFSRLWNLKWIILNKIKNSFGNNCLRICIILSQRHERIIVKMYIIQDPGEIIYKIIWKIWKDKSANRNYFPCLATKQSRDEIIRARHRSATLPKAWDFAIIQAVNLRFRPWCYVLIFMPFQGGRLSRPDQGPGRTWTWDRAMRSPRTCQLSRMPGQVNESNDELKASMSYIEPAKVKLSIKTTYLYC